MFKIQFIDSLRFMPTALSSFADNLSEIYTKKCRSCKKIENPDFKYCFVELNGDKLVYKCGECKKEWEESLDHKLIENFLCVYEFCEDDLDKFVLLLRKGVYPYEYMNFWEKFDETSLPDKTDFYNKLNSEDISDYDYEHAKNVWDVFEIKNMGEYHDLYVQTDTLLLADVFENFRNKCIKTYELDPLHFVSSPSLAWQACLKKTGVELELPTDINMVLMIEEGIRGGICQVSQQYSKANNKYMKDFDKNKKSTYIQYFNANNLYGWAMSQPLPANGFKWINNNCKFTNNFILNYDEYRDVGYILEARIRYPQKLHGKHKYLPHLPQKEKVIKCQKLICSVKGKEKYVVHIRPLKHALEYGLVLGEVHRVIKFNQKL